MGVRVDDGVLALKGDLELKLKSRLRQSRGDREHEEHKVG